MERIAVSRVLLNGVWWAVAVLAAWTPLSGLAEKEASVSPAAVSTPPSVPRARVILVVGAAGEPDYEALLAKQVAAWETTSQKNHAVFSVIGTGEPPGGTSDRDRLDQLLAAEPRESAQELWLVLVGHGTFDGREAKFNLRGPDLAVTDLALWLKPFTRPLAVVVATSSSAPFLAKLSAPGRVVIVATRSGYEQNYARFGENLAAAVVDTTGDLDRDGQVSLLEAFLTASHRTADFYKNEGRLMTEHALIDDNGDGLGTPADWFRGTRATKQAKQGAALDGYRANQWYLAPSGEELALSPPSRARRNELELQLESLRGKKSTLSAEEYTRRLEALLVELARLYQKPAT